MHPFAAPDTLTPGLARVRAYWEGLLRNAAPMPFWDDLVLGDLGDLERNAFTLEIFDKPERFRFGLLGQDLKQCCAADLEGVFLGEGDLPEVFGFLLSQASATVESGLPTLHRLGRGQNCARLLLPMWGEGRIGLLLGVVEWS